MTIRFKHFRTDPKAVNTTNHGCTFCYEYDIKTHKLSFAIAQCHRKDTYNKKEGRDTALDHFLKNNKLTVRYKTSKNNTLTQFFKELAYSLNY